MAILEEEIGAPLKRQRKQTAPVKKGGASKKLLLHRTDSVQNLKPDATLPVDIGEESQLFPTF
jgi:hypothetical protein